MPLLRGREYSGGSVATSAILAGVPTKLRVLGQPHPAVVARGLLIRCQRRQGKQQVSAPMRLSQYPINTMKETPAEAEVVSHQLMLRAGLIRRLAAGLYSWLPMGLKVLQKVERIIREEMNRAGAF